MEAQTLYEILGYVASILVAIALAMRSIVRLRVVNMIGALCFCVYGLLIEAYPVFVLNLLIVFINLYFLYNMFTAEEFFEVLLVNPESIYLKHFLEFYEKDIAKFLPGFRYDEKDNDLVWLILRDMNPAGVFIGKQNGETLHIHLDYVIPGYRDFKSGRFVYEESAHLFAEKGINTLQSAAGSPVHERYLQKVGFTQGGGGSYRKAV